MKHLSSRTPYAKSFKCIYIRKMHEAQTCDALTALAGLSTNVLTSSRYDLLPAVAVIVDQHGLPVWPASLFLVSKSIGSRGNTGDTTRTYGESLLPWLEYIADRNLSIDTVDEEVLKLYRIKCVHGTKSSGVGYSSSTANLRMVVAIQFHRWCQSNGYPSPLGAYLTNVKERARSIAPRVIRRHPKILSFEEIQRIMYLSKGPYKLMMRWGLVTGMRRFEVGGLRLSDLPTPAAMSLCEDGLARIDILRKGGRLLTVYAPAHLVEQTNWYVLTERPDPRSEHEELVFINNRGCPVSRQSVSREFRRCADEIGSKATLHHLRHTFAVHTLNFLEKKDGGRNSINSLKTVQLLLGHASMETSEIYLSALNVLDGEVVGALEYLNGGSIE